MLWKYVIYKCCEFEFGGVVGRILDVFHGNRGWVCDLSDVEVWDWVCVM